MLGHTFYHGTMHKLNTAFGALFNDIEVVYANESGVEMKRKNVPIEYGPKERWYIRQSKDPDLDRPISIQLPRMQYYMKDFAYDPSRKTNSLGKHSYNRNSITRAKQFSPVPYNFEYELYIQSKTSQEGEQIIEQIAPYFTPGLTVRMNTIPSIALKDKIPIILNSIQKEDNWNEGFDTLRSVIWTLSFTVKGNLYGHITDQGIIRTIIVDFYTPRGEQPVSSDDIANTPRSERVTITPDPEDALPGSGYTYDIEIEHFDDNKKRDPETGEDEEL